MGIGSLEGHKNNGDISYRTQLEVVPTGQIWDEMNIKIYKDPHGLPMTPC